MLALAAVLLAACPAASAQGAFVRLDVDDVRIQPDGRVVLGAYQDQDLDDELEAIGPGGAIVSRVPASFVDSRGVGWSARDGQIIGTRDGETVHSHAVDTLPWWRGIAEDARRRVWFACGATLVWFDGESWDRCAFETLGPQRDQDRTRIHLSADGERVYAWTVGGPGFVDVTGPGPTFTVVDLSRGLGSGAITDLVPIGAERVLTRPSFQVLSAHDWAAIVPEADRAPAEWTPRTRIVGRFELANLPHLVPTSDGSALVQSQRCIDWRDARPDPAGHDATIWTTVTPNLVVVPGGRNALIRVGCDGAVERLSPLEEAFAPTMVDRSGALWRAGERDHRGATYARLVDGAASTLVEAATGQPAKIVPFRGADDRGRAYFRSDGTWWMFDPTSEARADAPFAWRAETVEIWTPEREFEATLRCAAAVRDGALDRGVAIASWYGHIAAIAPHRLVQPTSWADAHHGLAHAVVVDEADRPVHLARVAAALGVDDGARHWIDVELDVLRDECVSGRYQRALAIAHVADEAGFGHRAVESYRVMLAHEPPNERDALLHKLEAVRCAVRHMHLETALEWAGELEAASEGRHKKTIAEQKEAIAALLAHPDDPETRFRFIQRYWFGPTGRRWHVEGGIRALEDLVDSLKMEAPLDLEVHTLLVDQLLDTWRGDEALVQVESLAATWRQTDEDVAALFVRVGGFWRRSVASGRPLPDARAKALAAFLRALELYDDPRDEGPAAQSARLDAADTLLEMGEADRAFELVRPILDGPQPVEGHARSNARWTVVRATLLLGKGYEAKGEIDEALVHARTAFKDSRPANPRDPHQRALRRESAMLVQRLQARLAEDG